MSDEFKAKVIKNCVPCPQKDNNTGYCIIHCNFGYEIYWGLFGLLRHLRGEPGF